MPHPGSKRPCGSAVEILLQALMNVGFLYRGMAASRPQPMAGLRPFCRRRKRPIPDIQRCSMLTHQLAQTGHSSMAQHFREANDRSADKVPMRCATRATGFKTH